MEKIIKPSVNSIPNLHVLAENYVKWGQEFKIHLDGGGKSTSFSFERSKGLYRKMRHQLSEITKGHCSFCDAHPIGETSKETIEHYYPKSEYPLQSYDWENLFYCCDKCQSESNKITFEETLKPDIPTYEFSNYFYFDLQSGELKILEHLESDNMINFNKAKSFLIRYGINNNPKRNQARKYVYRDIKNYLNQIGDDDDRLRDDFAYRYIYDYCVETHKV